MVRERGKNKQQTKLFCISCWSEVWVQVELCPGVWCFSPIWPSGFHLWHPWCVWYWFLLGTGLQQFPYRCSLVSTSAVGTIAIASGVGLLGSTPSGWSNLQSIGPNRHYFPAPGLFQWVGTPNCAGEVIWESAQWNFSAWWLFWKETIITSQVGLLWEIMQPQWVRSNRTASKEWWLRLCVLFTPPKNCAAGSLPSSPKCVK
jgi:hypothetical protein